MVFLVKSTNTVQILVLVLRGGGAGGGGFFGGSTTVGVTNDTASV